MFLSDKMKKSELKQDSYHDFESYYRDLVRESHPLEGKLLFIHPIEYGVFKRTIDIEKENIKTLFLEAGLDEDDNASYSYNSAMKGYSFDNFKLDEESDVYSIENIQVEGTKDGMTDALNFKCDLTVDNIVIYKAECFFYIGSLENKDYHGAAHGEWEAGLDK